jgi:hypothetical protein
MSSIKLTRKLSEQVLFEFGGWRRENPKICLSKHLIDTKFIGDVIFVPPWGVPSDISIDDREFLWGKAEYNRHYFNCISSGITFIDKICKGNLDWHTFIEPLSLKLTERETSKDGMSSSRSSNDFAISESTSQTNFILNVPNTTANTDNSNQFVIENHSSENNQAKIKTTTISFKKKVVPNEELVCNEGVRSSRKRKPSARYGDVSALIAYI